ncbi:hypothetical protein [Oceaniglobus indicus]|uniref:hypothetical protein n=1 Tax=Oceaniglobus indicus TaxID=2047749 RepID=UPI000C19C991|nr:hypothetical protein [Oceaniglobus indicus]
MIDLETKARQRRLDALSRVHEQRVNIFASRDCTTDRRVASVIGHLSDLRIRMGRRRIMFGQFSGEPLRLR